MMNWKSYNLEENMETFEGKKILVTGATGLIGSHIVELLLQAPRTSVIALSHSKEKLQQCFQQYLNNNRLTLMAQDVSKKIKANNHKIDYIFHAAGPISGNIVKNYPLRVIMPNVLGMINCCDLLVEQEKHYGHNGRIVVFSSETVYGHNESANHSVIEDETDLTDKLSAANSAYSQSKRMAEVLAQSYLKEKGIDVVIVRLGYVYGHTKFVPNTAFYEFINKAINGENIVFNNTKFLKRDNIYVTDAVNGIFTVCLTGLNGQAYNVSSNAEGDNYASIAEMAQIIADVVNKDCLATNNAVKVIQKDGLNITNEPGIMLNNNKLKALGWNIKVNLHEGIEETIRRMQP